MILYLYALADRVERLDGLAGVGGEPLLPIDVEGARLIGGWLAAPPALARATLEAQDRAIRALHDRAAALLPMRFGTVAEGIDAAIRSVSIIAGSLPDRFELVRGREQMTVRVLRTLGALGAQGASGAVRASGAQGASAPGASAPGASAPGASAPGATGTSYLRARSMRYVPPEIAFLLDDTRAIARATRVEPGSSDLIATVYQLVDRGEGREYRARLEQMDTTPTHLALRISGPSPAYAFARD